MIGILHHCLLPTRGAATNRKWRADAVPRAPLRALLAYNLLAALYLAWVEVAHRPAGILLWPAVAEHALVALLLATRMRDVRPER